MRLLAGAILAISLTASAQTAKVIALSQEDTAKAAALYRQRDAADKAMADFIASVNKKYVAPAKGWNNSDFEFTEDYKFIVPKKFEFRPNGIMGCNNWVNATSVPLNGGL